MHDTDPGFPPACPHCHRPYSLDANIYPSDETDPQSWCEDCDHQKVEEDLLDAVTDRLADELDEALAEYTDGRIDERESATTVEQVAVLREALRLMRSTLRLCPDTGEAEQPGQAAEQLRVLLSAAAKG